MSLFFRLFHVSDLHFGDTLRPSLPQRIVNWTPFPIGLEAHDITAVRQLAISMAAERRSFETDEWGLVATGDLTAFGTNAAFDIAYEYLRGKPGNLTSYSLDYSDTSVVPGNHDIWGGVIWGLSRNAQAVRDKYFNKPTPSDLSFSSFPYRTILHQGPPPIYLYGLDTTQVEKQNNINITWENFKAVGFLDDDQLDELQRLIESEPTTAQPIRIAALHHPLAYPTTNGSPNHLLALVNLDDVLLKLQGLGFAIALCGHQHKGFSRQMSARNSNYAPIHVFSTGTATQVTVPGSPHNNEYRFYDFETNRDDECRVVVNCLRLKDVSGLPQFTPDNQEHIEINLELKNYRYLKQRNYPP